ncbi:iron-siderophore ABC transporter substrate-binding protein [Thalassiella azotivora]
MRVRAVLAALAATSLLAACSSSEDSGTSGDTAGSSDGAFPVTIEHAFGETTIESEPERVVTLGWNAQDVVWALGVDPVGIPRFDYGANEDGLLAWDVEHYDPEVTTLLDTTDGPPMEAIATLEPDVILAPYEGFDEAVYEQLAAIAPTVAYPGEPWQTSWQDQTTIVGEALGKADEAQQLVDDIDTLLAEQAAEHPELEGLTFTYASLAPDTMSVYLPGDPRVQLVEQLGMTNADGVQALAEANPGSFYADVSLENVPDTSSQVLIAFTEMLAGADPSSIPAYAQLPALQNGSAALFDDQQQIAAFSSVSVLSIPYGLDVLLPKLSEAAAKVPAS